MSGKAKSLKEAGNTAFRQAKYEDAVLLYTEACQLDPSEYTYPLNRCMCYLKLNKLREAERDATKSLQLLPAGNPKALYRRGLARKGLGKIDLARQDFEAVLKEEPANVAVKAELESLPKAQPSSEAPVAAKAPPKADTRASSSPTTVKLQASGPSLTKPASTNGATTDRKSALRAAITPEASNNTEGGFLSAVSTRRITKPSTSNESTDDKANEDSAALKASVVASATAGSKDFKSLRAARDQRFRAVSPIPVSPTSSDSVAKPEASSSAVPSSESPSTNQSTLPNSTVPRNMYEFEKRWNDNRDTASRASMVLALVKQRIPLPAFFGSNLSPELLDEMLECLRVACREYPDCRSASVDFLSALPQCPRFDFVSMVCANTSLVKDIVDGDSRAPVILSAWGTA